MLSNSVLALPINEDKVFPSLSEEMHVNTNS